MGRRKPYLAVSGSRVPGVTGIIGDCKSDGQTRGLMGWARNQALDGGDHRVFVKNAAVAGNISHDLIEWWCRAVRPEDGEAVETHPLIELYGKQVPDLAAAEVFQTSIEKFGRKRKKNNAEAMLVTTYGDTKIINRGVSGFVAFHQWLANSRMRILENEVRMVSEKHLFGGMLDAIAESPDGTLALLDFKTSNALYEGHFVQVCAYDLLHRENRRRKFKRVDLLRIGKEYSDFTHHSWPHDAVERGQELFLHMLEIYKLRRELKPLVR